MGDWLPRGQAGAQGALGRAVSGPALGWPCGRVRLRPTTRPGLKPQRAAAVGAGARPGRGGNAAPLLPDCSSRVRCWPCPWCSRCHLALSAAAQPPAGCRLPGRRVGGGAACCENPGLGEQRVASQAGTSEILGQLPRWGPGWPLRAPVRASLGPFAERSRSRQVPALISAQGAVSGGCRMLPPGIGLLEAHSEPHDRADSFHRRPPSASPHKHSLNCIFKEIITTAIRNSFVWFL